MSRFQILMRNNQEEYSILTKDRVLRLVKQLEALVNIKHFLRKRRVVSWILSLQTWYWLCQTLFSNVNYQVFLMQQIFKVLLIKYLLFLMQEVEHLISKELHRLPVQEIPMRNATSVHREQSSQLLIVDLWLKLALTIIKMQLLREELFMLKILK